MERKKFERVRNALMIAKRAICIDTVSVRITDDLKAKTIFIKKSRIEMKSYIVSKV